MRVAISECQNLEVLCLAALKGLDDDVAFSIARNLPNIRILNIKNGNFSDCGICEIAAYCNELQLLNVAGNHKLTDRSVFSLAENCTKLEEFYLSGCAKVTKAALQYLSVRTLHTYVPCIYLSWSHMNYLIIYIIYLFIYLY